MSDVPDSAPTRELYEELPYPADGVVRTAVARALRDTLRARRPELLRRKGLLIADVGCGTGETTAGIARLFPGARVVGFDVNARSLELARELAAHERARISFVRGDLTQELGRAVEAAGRRFDVVTSMGVLHHLPAPEVGFRAVRSIVDDDGLFMTFVYSKYGRWDDSAAKEILDHAFGARDYRRRADAVRRLRLTKRQTLADFVARLGSRLRFGPAISPMEMLAVALRRNRLVHDSDTFSNPCEHLFEYGEVESLMSRTGWRLLGLAEGFGLPTSIESFTRDPRTRELLRAMRSADVNDYLAYVQRAWGFGVIAAPAAP